jgi:putative oxidoreductase
MLHTNRSEEGEEMEEFLDRHRPYFLSVMRIMVGLLLIPHGTAKFFGWPETGRQTVELFSLMGLAATIEIVGGILLAIGLFTRTTAFIVSGFLAAAYFMAHAPQDFLPIVNRGELAALWCFVALYIFFAGAGPWSVDAMLERDKPRPVYSR